LLLSWPFLSRFGPKESTREAVLVVGDAATALALQTDGKVVVAGLSDQNSALVRYNPPDSLDLSFGQGGLKTLESGLVLRSSETALTPAPHSELAG